MNNQAEPYIYDQIPYPNLSFTQTHPNRLATIATLLGMTPPSIERCRVLELGCAQGGNILPMAQQLPNSEFVGIDLSERQVQEGEKNIQELGFKNITLKQADILELNGDLGKFDYIIAHGVYSWVPADVQEKILEICSRDLTPNGVAYVSYNTYPGWHMMEALRNMMLYHIQEIKDPHQRAQEARNFLNFLGNSAARENNTPHGSFLKIYIDSYKNTIGHHVLENEALFTHDELSEINNPIYFHQFVERAKQHHLQYLADANLQAMLASNLPKSIAETLRTMVHSTVELEQYLDFLYNRTFRQTLMCHENIHLTGSPNPECITQFYVGSSAMPKSSKIEVQGDTVETFHVSTSTISTNHPLTKAAMLYLMRIWPQVVSFDHLVTAAYNILEIPLPSTIDIATNQDIRMLSVSLLQAYSYYDALVELNVYSPSPFMSISDYPKANEVSRLQAETGGVVTNLRHERVTLDSASYHLLPYLDGQHDHKSLIDVLQKLALQGIIQVQKDSDGHSESNTNSTIVIEEEEDWGVLLKDRLRRLAIAALLVG